MLYITSSRLIYFVTGDLNFFTPSTHFAHTSVSMSLGVLVFWFYFFSFKTPHTSEILWDLSFSVWLFSFNTLNGRSSFLYYGSHHVVYVSFVFFVLSSINEHSVCFHVLTIEKNAVMNIGMCVSFNLVLLFHSDMCPEVELLNHMVVLFLIFSGTSKLLPIVAAPIYISTHSTQGFPSPHPCQNMLFLAFLMIAILTGIWCLVLFLLKYR